MLLYIGIYNLLIFSHDVTNSHAQYCERGKENGVVCVCACVCDLPHFPRMQADVNKHIQFCTSTPPNHLQRVWWEECPRYWLYNVTMWPRKLGVLPRWRVGRHGGLTTPLRSLMLS